MAAAGRPAAAVCMVGEGKKRDMKGDRGRSPRPPEAGATSEARGFRRSRNGLRPYFRFAGDDR